MNPEKEATVHNRLEALREKRGLSAADLAKLVGLSRQTVYAMEAGSYVPNTAVALRLARALEVPVEALFQLPEDDAADYGTGEAQLLPGSDAPAPGQPIGLCRVDGQLVASPAWPMPWFLPPADGIATGPTNRGRTPVRLLHSMEEPTNRILLAGCDPGISILGRHLQAAGVEMSLVHRNSSQSLALLKHGFIHVAGTHLRDETSGESNLPEIQRTFEADSVAVVTYAAWEEGLVVPRGNPKRIRGVEDLTAPDVSIVNREPGSGARRLLDSELERLGIDGSKLQGYDSIASGHLTAVWQVRTGGADCAIATSAAARMFGLDFIALAAERYDLAMRRAHLELPAVQTLLDTLTRSKFRRELEAVGGYETRLSGQRRM